MSPLVEPPRSGMTHRELAEFYMDNHEEHMADAAKAWEAAVSEKLLADIEENRVTPRIVENA